MGLNTVIRGFFVTKYTESADRINVFIFSLPWKSIFGIYSTTLERISFIFGDIMPLVFFFLCKKYVFDKAQAYRAC